jgi:hypothetical protein
VNDAENDPSARLVTVAGDVVTGVPSYVIVISEEPAKLVPVTVTDAPTGPLVGLRVIVGDTVNVAEAELLLASVAATV